MRSQKKTPKMIRQNLAPLLYFMLFYIYQLVFDKKIHINVITVDYVRCILCFRYTPPRAQPPAPVDMFGCGLKRVTHSAPTWVRFFYSIARLDASVQEGSLDYSRLIYSKLAQDTNYEVRTFPFPTYLDINLYEPCPSCLPLKPLKGQT